MSETTTTPNYGLIKPNVNADADLWGDHWNSNADVIDTQLKQVSNKAGVTSWNTRAGAVSLTNADVVTVLPGSVTAPLMDGTATAGLATTWAKGDHVHPTDTTRYAASNPSGYQTAAQVTTALGPYAPLANPVFTGDPRAPTPTVGDNDTSVATTAFVTAAVAGAAVVGVASFNTRTGAVTLSNADVVAVLPASSTTPGMDGTAAVGTGTTWARADHVHPSDTTRAPLASPLFTGDPRSVTPPNGDNDFSIATTAFVQTAVAPAFNGVGRNLIHNPLFTVAQRGAGPFTASGAYTLDRWQITATLDTVSIGIGTMSDADRAAIGDEAAQWSLYNTWTGNAGATAANYLVQKVENVRRLAGKTVTISLWAKANSGTPKLGLNIANVFGTGGSPSAAVWATAVAITTSTSWARYSATITVPSVSGMTLGTNNDNSSWVSIWYSSGANTNALAGGIGVQSGVMQIWGVQLEVGSVATPLEKPDPQQDLAKCQRFYQTYQAFIMSNYNAAGASSYTSLVMAVPMRAGPTVGFANQTYSNMSGVAVNGTPSTALVKLMTTTTATGFGYAITDVTLSADL